MDDEAVKGVAYAHAPRLGVSNNAYAFLEVSRLVEICIDDSSSCLNAGDLGVVANEIDEAAASARYDEVDVSDSFQQFSRCLVRSRHKVHGIGFNAFFHQYPLDQSHGGAVGRISITAALQQACIAALEAQREHVESDIRPRLVDDSYHSERNAYLLESQPVGQSPLDEGTA